MTNQIIPVLRIDAIDAYVRGQAHGQALRKRIRHNIALYRRVLGGYPHVGEYARKYAEQIKRFRPSLSQEMKGIAEGAAVPFEDICMLNARTELFNRARSQGANECFTFFFAQNNLLCQNWDWWQPCAAGVASIIYRTEHGTEVATFTEAGMLGKFGLSSAGFGIAFTYLFPRAMRMGTPIHALLRAVLDCASFKEAQLLLQQTHSGAAGSILLADAHGSSNVFELDGTATSTAPKRPVPMHTNHFLNGANDPAAGEGSLRNSRARLSRAETIVHMMSAYDAKDAKTLLGTAAGEGALCCGFAADDPGDEPTGSVASVVMDLKKLTLDVALVPHLGRFETIQISSPLLTLPSLPRIRRSHVRGKQRAT